MVETVMIFALGFLAAALIALLIIPAINGRAERLARRRAEALFPMSISELTAEKDHLRAEFAIRQRRIEQKAEEAFAVRHQSMEELGRRALRIETLDSALADRNETIVRLETELTETRSILEATQKSLTDTSAALAETRETLAALETTHRTTVDQLGTMRQSRDQLQASLTATSSQLTRTSHDLAQLEESYASTDAALTAALSEIDARRIAISDLETRLMTQRARGDDFERALGERHSELSDERKRLAVLSKGLASEQERGLILEQHIREIEADREAKAAELGRVTALLDANRHDLTEQAARASQTVTAENEELRQRIRQLADQILSAGKRAAISTSPNKKPAIAATKRPGKATGKRKRQA